MSNALNGTGRLSEATRQRVLAAARELGYAPAGTARAQAHGSTGVLGLTMTTYGDLPVPYTEIPYYGQLALGAMAAAHGRGYLLMVLPNSLSPWMWLNTPMDGVIHVAPRTEDPVSALLRERASRWSATAGRPGGAGATPGSTPTTTRACACCSPTSPRRGPGGSGSPLPVHDDAYPQQVESAYTA